MFTGIVEEAGTIAEIVQTATGARLTINASSILADVRLGDSIAVNGVCLTATELTDTTFAVDAIPETLDRSNLGSLAAGEVVNLERPMPASGRFDGHIVQGHVDGVGVVESAPATPVDGDEGVELEVRPPAGLMRYIVEKGSITIDGVSLTVATAAEHTFTVALIPHTLKVTNLGRLAEGATVNLEVDVIAKYVERLMEAQRA